MGSGGMFLVSLSFSRSGSARNLSSLAAPSRASFFFSSCTGRLRLRFRNLCGLRFNGLGAVAVGFRAWAKAPLGCRQSGYAKQVTTEQDRVAFRNAAAG